MNENGQWKGKDAPVNRGMLYPLCGLAVDMGTGKENI